MAGLWLIIKLFDLVLQLCGKIGASALSEQMKYNYHNETDL